jgi:predicted metal-dependent phosphoesterase TrpH
MLIRGALHVHSSLSHDGTLPIAKLVQWYRAHGYQFAALGEHSQDMDEVKVRALVEQSNENSSTDFCLIPGIEFACKGGLHIVGVGVTSLVKDLDPVRVAQAIHGHGGYAVLAHPKRYNWKCPLHVVGAIDAAEIWNVAHDGKFLPSPQSVVGFRRLRQVNPRLLAIAGHDFHRQAGFYDVAIEMDVPGLSRQSILQNLRLGAYTIRARLFSCNAQANFSWFQSTRLRWLGWQIGKLREARDLLLQWSSFAKVHHTSHH